MLSSLVVGLYAWVVTVFFGAVLLDVVYSNMVPEAATAFSAVADFLLRIGAVTVLAALAAIVLSWKSGIARTFFIASLAVISLEFLIPMFFSQLLQDTQGSVLASGTRIAISGLGSILAFVGLWGFCCRRQGSGERRT
ncbi:MAG: hypothetical protein OEV76_06275 [Anaerolineae bacterium]|nr:hypothetical protein [Anaerolineae bacterium]